MAAIQVIGKQAVLDTYEAYGIDTWALVQEKKLRIAGDSYEQLESWLTRYEPARSTASYALRLYDGIEPSEVTVNTPYRYCIDFKLTDTYDGMGIMGGYQSQQLSAKVTELEKKLKDYEESDTEEREDTLNDVIMGYLDNPVKLQQIAGALNTIFRGARGEPVQMAGKQIAASSPPPGTADKAQDVDAEAEKLASILDRLQSRDPDILQHLEKLAEIAEKKPKTFNFLLSNLDGL